MNAVEARALTRKFGELVAVDHIDLEVRDGEVFAFLGPNGAGKTTTIHMFTTLLKPSGGRAWVMGFDVEEEPENVRRVIGLVPQELTVDDELTGLENLLLQAALYGIHGGEAEERAGELLRLMDLEDAARRRVMGYSGGMRRRLALAQGLIHRPKLLFLDEPTLGLDVQTRAAVWGYIEGLRKEGITIFLTTHYMEEAERLADRVAIIDRGRIVALGTPGELKAQVGGDIVEFSVLGDAVDCMEVLRALPFVQGVWNVDNVVRVRVGRGEEALPLVLQALQSKGIIVNAASISKPSLESVYLQLTGRTFRDVESEDAMRARFIMRRMR